MSKKKLIIVLGMYRSGTSLLTKSLEVLGVHLGDKLMPPDERVNPKGFYEDLDFNRTNIDILKAIDLECIL